MISKVKKKMKYYLIEAYSPDIKFDSDDTIVALTPLVSYELDKEGVKYSILEDYYDESKFLEEEEDYFNNQLDWFNKFDDLLFNIYPKAKNKNLNLATNYYRDIKHMVDSIILRCKVIDIFINKVKPNSIIYVSTNWEEDLISSTVYPLLFGAGQSLFSRLIPIFCKKYNIDFQRIIIREAIDSKSIYSKYKNFIIQTKCNFKSNKYIRSSWHYYRKLSFNNILPKFLKNPKSILFLKTGGYNIIDVYKTAQKEGHRVFYKHGNNIIRQSFLYHKVIESIYPDIISSSKQETKSLLKEINKTDLLNWLSDYCKIDVTTVILPRLRYFIENWCLQIISLIDKYIKFYNNYQIDLVITPYMVSVDEFAAIIASRYSEKTKSACLQHGDDVFMVKTLDFAEHSPYDIYFTTNYEREQYIKHRIKFKGFDTKVFQYSNRYKMLSKVSNLKRKVRSKANRKTLVYVPTMYQWDNTFWTESRVPNTWYFSWHKELINYFGSRKDFNFIWKGIPASNETYDPIPNLINDRKYINIKYATDPFIKFIKRADLVLLDYSSTALYEAAVSGLPVMSLFFAPFNIVREPALKLFGKSLEPFNNFDEGIAKIDDFLNSNPNEFIVSIPRSEKSIADFLKSFKK